MLAFDTNYSFYEFIVMSFGLKNAYVIFMDWMNIVFKSSFQKVLHSLYWWHYCLFEDKKSMRSNHTRFLPRLANNKFYIKFEKCYLG